MGQISEMLRIDYLFILHWKKGCFVWRGPFPVEKEVRILHEIRLNEIYGVFEIGAICGRAGAMRGG